MRGILVKKGLWPKWLLHALFSIFWWGIWGFVVKLGSDKISPRQMQILFMVGMVPLVFATLVRLSFRVDMDRLGITYGVLNGVFTTLGLLAYYAAMQRGPASLVGPVTALFPLVTVVLAFVLLHERINKVQMAGVVLALLSIFILSM